MALIETAKFPGAIASETDMLNWRNVVPSSSAVTLGASMGSADTSLTVTAGTGAKLPSDNFVISIDDEIIFVRSRTTDTLAVTRGYEGTTATTHNSGTTVAPRVTAKAHNQLVSEMVAVQNALGVNLANVLKLTGGTMTGRVVMTPSTTSASGFSVGFSGTAPTTPSIGDVWFDGTSISYKSTSSTPRTLEITSNKNQANGYCGLDASGLVPSANLPSTGGAITLAYYNNGPVTVNTATTAVQQLMTMNLASNEWNQVGKLIRFRCFGTYSTQSSTPTVLLKIAIVNLSTIVQSQSITTSASLSNKVWNFEIIVAVTSTGTTTNASATGIMNLESGTVGGPWTDLMQASAAQNAWNGTLAQQIACFVQFGNSSTANSCTQNIMTVEYLN